MLEVPWLMPGLWRASLQAAAVGVMTTDAMAQLASDHDSAAENAPTVPAAAAAAAAETD